MDWIKRLNSAINYIEENIMDAIDMEKVAKIAGCSSYHFQRMFAYMAEMSTSEYIRKRKMSLAAVDIINGEKVIDVAIKFGYDSPTAFNRAFKSIHNIAPSRMKEDGVMVKAFPPIHFQISIKGDREMNYRIVKKEAFKIVGISEPLEKELEKNFEIVPGMWERAAMDGTISSLAPLMNTELEARIVREWLPTSGYEYANAPDIEVYINADPQNAIFEVWIPVIRK